MLDTNLADPARSKDTFKPQQLSSELDSGHTEFNQSTTSPSAERSSVASDGTTCSSRATDEWDVAPVALSDIQQTREASYSYRLLRKLDQGGLGTVWLARDEMLHRLVALKELRLDHNSSEKSRQRFHREAEITGQLEHQSIVSLHLFGEDQQTGESFYTMPYVGKRTLANAIEEHEDRIAAGEDVELGLHRLLSIFLDICHAIAYAHSRGVIHRDLKPENIAVDNFGRVTVLDWGLAKLLDDGELAFQRTASESLSSTVKLSASALTRTRQGEVMGTPKYMAPEQAAGDSDNVDKHTDVYGLGAILFGILTGEPPHRRASSSSQSDADMLRTIAEGPSPRAQDRCPRVCSALDEICAKAMARKPHLRYATVQEFADAVERWMAGQRQQDIRYEKLRVEGRELRAGLNASMRNLERNVLFMSRLPPMGMLRGSVDSNEFSAWRERLALIFCGLLDANPNYQRIVYERVGAGDSEEIVRVERPRGDPTRVRSIPKSRLKSGRTHSLTSALQERDPDDVKTTLIREAAQKAETTLLATPLLSSGVPVFDGETEESVGVIRIECELARLLQYEANLHAPTRELVACALDGEVLFHFPGKTETKLLEETIGEADSRFASALDKLRVSSEYVDTRNHKVYGARIALGANDRALAILLQ